MIDIAKLRDARLALQAGRFDLAEEILAKFRETDLRHARSPLEKRQISDELGQIRSLSAAMRDGLALARERIRQILGASRRLETYDRAGARQVGATAPSEVGRF
ncbi:hypothetical protein ACHFJ0_06355 [Paracoccus sp. NGMCC 1.201697]|uniref:Flagellar protein FlgN n=1 Tax=Paracoccus broussonetiae subsp. drimophilus TaxID=3373869 RepID=A0ABW7LHP4_9RHOB